MITQPTLPQKNEELWDKAHIRNAGLFFEYSQTISKYSFVAAMRLDFNTATSNPLSLENMQGQPLYYEEGVESSFVNFSFSAGTEFRFNQKVSMEIYAGRGVRSPDMTERYIILLPIGYDNYDYLGNPALKPEQNYQGEISVKWLPGKFGKLKLTAFYSYVIDYITGQLVRESSIKPQTKGVYGVKQFINIDRAMLSGIEFEYRSPENHPWLLEAIAGYTMGVNPLATSYIIEDGEITGSEEVKNDPLAEIPPFEGTFRFSYRLFNGKLTPAFSIRGVAAQKRISQAYDERNTPGFVLLNMSVVYQFNKVLQVSGGIDNLLNHAYYEHLNRNIIGSEDNLYEPGINAFVNLRFKL
jgi:iron complex outermembrane receptor protein